MFKQLTQAMTIVSLALLTAACSRIAQVNSYSPIAEPVQRFETPVTLPKPNHQLADHVYYWEQRMERDSIAPIYEPTFLPAAEANYQPDELIIGVALNGEAKAYAIGPLNAREMINDTLGGVPILVTW